MLWKKISLTSLLLCLLWIPNVSAKVSSDDCLGFWLTEDQDATIQVYKNKDGLFNGKIVWLRDLHTGKEKQILDTENQDESKRKNPILGMVNMKSFKFDSNDEEWVDGTIYDPVKGKNYSAKMKLKNGKMHLRGFVGIPLFGRTSIWTKEEKAIPKKYD